MSVLAAMIVQNWYARGEEKIGRGGKEETIEGAKGSGEPRDGVSQSVSWSVSVTTTTTTQGNHGEQATFF